jgi:MFS family permease
LQGHWHYSAIKTGFASAPGPVLFATFAAVAETLQQRYKIRPGAIAAVGTAIAAVGALLFTFLLHENPSYLTGFLPCWVLIGIGFGLAIPTTVSAATVDLRPEQAATGSAIVSMSMQIGSLLVASLGKASGAASLSVFRHAWLLSVPIGALAIITAFGMNPKHTGDTVEEAAELLVLAEAEA